MDKRHYIVSLLLLLDGVLLIVLAFIHLLATPIIKMVLAGELTVEALLNSTAPNLLNHMVIGILLIPFGISTLYSASGVGAGQRWARNIALLNALGVLILPLFVEVMAGRQYFSSATFRIAAILITVIGISMFIPLLWLKSGPRKERHF